MIKCFYCKSHNVEEGDTTIDYDKGTYTVYMECEDCNKTSICHFKLDTITGVE